MQKESNAKIVILFILIAYAFSVLVRFTWVYQNGGVDEFIWNGSYIINTNDGYFFGSGVQKMLYGLHANNPLVPTWIDRGLVFVTTILAKILPFSLDTIMFYMPAFFASLIVIPVILIGNLYKKAYWGFLAALIAGVAWSYYKRTMLGYYDTDMFSLPIVVFVLYFLLKSIVKNDFNALFFGSLIAVVYTYLYHPGKSALYAMGIIYAIYLLIFNKDREFVYKSLIILFIALTPLPLPSPWSYIARFILAVALYLPLSRDSKSISNTKTLLTALAVVFIAFLYFSDAFHIIISKMQTYTKTGVESHGLKFFGVFQTIAEASKIPFFSMGTNYQTNVADRVIGSSLGFIVALIGYAYLVFKRKEFLIALPLIGIGLFAHWGGLRFTIYAIPIAALGITYIFIDLSKNLKQEYLKILAPLILTIIVLIPTLNFIPKHNKRVSPVFTKSEIKDLDKLKNIAKRDDFTLSWWDYGYPLWYYTNTFTLIDGSKHRHDNFVIAKILLSDSSTLASNLAKLSVEEYAKGLEKYKEYEQKGKNEENIQKEYKFTDTKGNIYHAGKCSKAVIDFILKDNQKNQKEPNEFLEKLSSNNFKLPAKTRDIYLYMPIKSINIFPAIVQFANLDLTTGKRLRDVVFYSSPIYKYNNGLITLRYGTFNTKTGLLKQRGNNIPIDKFIVTEISKDGDIKLEAFKFNSNSNFSIIYIKSLNRAVLLDNKTLNSLYVKMFLLGLYDKDKFELTVKSPYGRVYKVK